MTEATHTRRHQAEERREQILDAACRVFSAKGYAGASIRDIAREVGVTEGLLYHYFDNKEQLMEACWRERSWRVHLERILSESGGIPLEQMLRALVQDFLQTLYENRDMVRMCAAEMMHNPEMAEFYRQRIDDNHRLITDFLRARQLAGEIRPGVDLDTPASLLMGCAYSMMLLYSSADRAEWDRIVERFLVSSIEIVMRGIVPPGDAK